MNTLKNLRTLLTKTGITAGIVAATIFIGCSDNSVNSNGTTIPANMSQVTMSTGMEPGTISAATSFAKSSQISTWNGTTCDSITVTRARIVIKTLKLHQVGDVNDDDDHGNGHHDDNDHDGTIKAGPFIAEFDSSGEKIISSVIIPPGVYDRIKFEIHKLNENEDASLLNDPLFGDFVNGGRYTVIIEGHSYVNGIAYGFTFKSSLTANLQVFLDSVVVFDSTKAYDLSLSFDPKIVFGRPGMRPLDPRDVDNQHALEGFIERSIKLLRHKH
jgi:hypothetical protein